MCKQIRQGGMASKASEPSTLGRVWVANPSPILATLKLLAIPFADVWAATAPHADAWAANAPHVLTFGLSHHHHPPPTLPTERFTNTRGKT